jgi:hypothetical protein
MSGEFTMPRIGDVVARIATQVPAFQTVTHALGLDVGALLSEPAALPAAVVAPLSPAILPGEMLSQTHAQTADWRCGVLVLLHRQVSVQPSAGTADDWDDLTAALRQALAGWAPPGEGARLRWIGGSLEQVAPGYLAWRDDYECRRLLRHVPAADLP